MRIFENRDCIDGMKEYPDKYFSIAIVDPPYGINFAKTHTGNGWTVRESKEWDKNSPDVFYFEQLFRVSKNQIIWGGNYMVKYLSPSQGWIVWDKGQRDFSLADAELAYTSFNKALRVFNYSRAAALQEGKIHPTQKPVALYRWLVKNYVKPGDIILDTHVGSASSLIAYEEAGLSYVGYELDTDYYNAAQARLKNYREIENPFGIVTNPWKENEKDSRELL